MWIIYRSEPTRTSIPSVIARVRGSRTVNVDPIPSGIDINQPGRFDALHHIHSHAASRDIRYFSK
jgi:hypothetical protein